ncbi:MAG: hypothetical protein AAF228_12195 [Pseudomonadota bacterium]
MQNIQEQTIFRKNCQSVDFESINVHLKEKGYWVVTVSGQKPEADMKVELIPMIYDQQPEYWGIALRGQQRVDDVLASDDSFQAKLPLSGCKGVKGIEIIGSTKREKVDIVCASNKTSI